MAGRLGVGVVSLGEVGVSVGVISWMSGSNGVVFVFVLLENVECGVWLGRGVWVWRGFLGRVWAWW